MLVGLWLLVVLVEEEVGLAVVVGLTVVVDVVVGLTVVVDVVVGLVVDVGRWIVELVFGGVGGLVVRVGVGRVPPFVGVSTLLPSQYMVSPSSVRSFKTVLIPAVPGPLQYVPFVWFTVKGTGYSM